MTTVVSTTKTQPAITMDKMHVDSFTLTQARDNNPKRVLGMSIVLYGLDADGNKSFDSETMGVNDADFDATVYAAAIADGKTTEQFMLDYTTAKAEVTAELEAGISNCKLMAYFEAALGRIAELHDKVVVSGVE